jgi:CelD/BcsL family acetyltransferase involved in cellulose biosynthesis
LPALPLPSAPADVPVSIHRDPAVAADAWARLETRGIGTGYQSLAWARTWFDTCTAAAGRRPLVCLFGEPESPLAILPLEVGEVGLARVGRGPGGRHANFRGILMDPGAGHLPWGDLLGRAASAAGIDAILLANQIVATPQGPHPLLALPQSRPATAYAARLDLCADPDETLAKVLGKGSRKTLGKKTRQLASQGPVETRRAGTQSDVDALMDLFFREKSARLAELGVPDAFAEPAVQAFLNEGARIGNGTLVLYGLWCGDRPAAMFAGVELGGRLSGCINAHELAPEVSRCSPGEILFCEVIRDAARRGLAVFDLGVGHGPLKDRFCEREEAMFDTGIAVTTLGTCALMMLSAADWMKATIQRDERLVGPARRLAGWLGLADLR